MSLSTPVAFLIFNRPELTKVVFEAIRQAQPQKLLVVADGPRFPEEVQKCQKTREIINQVDWECEVLTNFSDINLGCEQRVISGIDWVFAEVEEAIILEDDCLPSQSFFQFCQTLLEHYRHDERVMHISGNQFNSRLNKTDYSYSFSKYGGTWGWASWRRAWQHFDRDMKSWSEFKTKQMMKSICSSLQEELYWTNIFDRVFNNEITTCWDYQWLYTRWIQNDLSIVPKTNLVSNIGFGADATHTFSSSPLAKLPTTDIWDIKHPLFMVRDTQADNYTFACYYGGQSKKTYHLLKSKFKKVLNL